MRVRDMSELVDDRPQDGVFRLHRDVFTDPGLFELELQYIFERCWCFLGIESQIAQPHDFVATDIGRTPVLLTRDGNGKIGAFLNACRHKGALVCPVEQGNARVHVCPYHGWSYASSGRNVGIKDHEAGAYLPAFEAEDHDLVPLPRLATYKGLIFGSLTADVPPLEDFLGDMKFFLDLAMEQGPHGMEFVPGRTTYTYRANWKLQLDNGVDGYHLTSTHQSFMQVQGRRRGGEGNLDARQFDWAKRKAQQGGMYGFPHGHSVIWFDQPELEKRPLYPSIAEVRERVGELRADWMLKLRNLSIFPAMQIAEGITLMLRTFRPLAVDRTEMRSYCLAPIGEAPDRRAWRLRQYEDFFNPGGLATPDDTIVYEDCQRGLASHGLPWLQGYARGMGTLQNGADETARRLGIRPAESGRGSYEGQAETPFHAPYREWARLMQAGMAGQSVWS
jgi:benzoate/toluate 1,2-dioxygenase subunit alpha